MHTLRGWIFYLWFSITLIPAATTVLLLWPFAGAEFRYEKVALVWCRLMVNSLRVICGVNYRVIGLENLPKSSETPVVVLSKHQSAWETLFLPLILGNPAGFVYKKSLQVFCRLKTAKSRIYIFCFLCFFIHIYVICHSDKSSMTVIFRFSEIIIFSSFIFFISRIIALRSTER